ncbi:MAG: hypothetical protein IAI49_04435 [Candidatus Eremiobacteraeota bacterium]|nr:hypothetical protein [Candidatus Eremiobacteraeota bacterium]
MSGEFDAFNAQTGKKVWSTVTASGINAPPMTFAQDGQQYVSIEVGLGGVFPLFFAKTAPSLAAVKPGSMVYTYKLPRSSAMAPSK